MRPTRVTEVSAIEARRNEELVRAEGSLLGERRVAIARVAMVGAFAVISVTRGGPPNHPQTIVGAIYAMFGALALYGLWRHAKPSIRASMWLPFVTTTVDYTATLLLGLTELRATHVFASGQQVIGAAIVLSFSIARVSLWHVVYALVCAELSFFALATSVDTVGSHQLIFVMVGYGVLAFVLALNNRAIGTMFQGLRARDNLTRFLPRQVAERILRAGPSALAPVQREVTVLFSDIRGFTGMSEGLEPRDVLAMLDDYFGRMSAVVKGHDGVVGKFLGDGMLAFWGVPDDQPDHAELAVRAARDMRAAVRELNRERERDGLPAIKIGIGIHTGTVAAGMLGGALQAEYTVIGDAVNVASRIEGLTKDHGVDVLVSETTRAKLADGAKLTRVAEGQIRGRKESVVLFGLASDDAA